MRMRLMSWLLLVCVLSCGCNERPQTYVVHGMVIYPDGKPLTKGSIEFDALNQKRPITATGEIGPDGTFVLGTFEPNDGAIAGEHRVAVISDFEIGTGIERPDELPPERIDPKYRDFKTSGLKQVIKPQANNILIEIDYPPSQKKSDASDQQDLSSKGE